MKSISYLVLPVSLLIAACQMQSPNSGMPECKAQNHFTITPSASAVDVVPPHICVQKGSTITVNVAGNHKMGSVATSPKVSTDTWLYGSNAVDSKKFYLYVNSEVSTGPHDYSASTQNGKVLDPRVTVIE